MSEQETAAILQSGEECVESGCSVEDVTALIKDLREQKEVLTDRQVKIMNTIQKLQIAIGNKVESSSETVVHKKKEERDEFKLFVRDLLRVFSQEKPDFPPSALDFGKGPFDAYDVLEPKPWKPLSKSD